ncbi:MAG: hypothetical protein WC919_01015 [Candidatus Paceibacterota bacterium]|jgi:hypothetical protein
MANDRSVPDHVWWFSDFAEFEDFVGIGEERAIALAEKLDDYGYSQTIIARMLTANNVPLNKVFVVPDKLELPERVIHLDDVTP